MPSGIRLTREELYKMVWQKTLRDLAKDLGVSDRGLGKTCKRLHIPTPGNSYWMKKYYGKPVEIEPLSETDTGISRNAWFPGPRKNPVDDSASSSVELEAINFENDGKNKIVVETPKKYSQIVEATFGSIGVIEPDTFWHNSGKTLSACCSKENVLRAANIWDALIQAFRERGYILTLEPEEGSYGKRYETFVTVQDVKVKILLTERSKKVLIDPDSKPQYKPPFTKRWKEVPSGQLMLRAYHKDRETGWNSITRSFEWGFKDYWADDNRSILETKLNAFILGLVKIAIYTKQKAIRDAAVQKERLETQERQKYEKWRVEYIKHASELMDQAEKIRRFIRALENHEFSTKYDTKQDWITWGYAYADSLDPVLSLSKTVNNLKLNVDDDNEDDWEEDLI